MHRNIEANDRVGRREQAEVGAVVEQEGGATRRVAVFGSAEGEESGLNAFPEPEKFGGQRTVVAGAQAEHRAETGGMDLALLGGILLGARLLWRWRHSLEIRS